MALGFLLGVSGAFGIQALFRRWQRRAALRQLMGDNARYFNGGLS